MARLASVAEYSLTGMDTSPNEMLNVPIDRAAIALPPIFFRDARPREAGWDRGMASRGRIISEARPTGCALPHNGSLESRNCARAMSGTRLRQREGRHRMLLTGTSGYSYKEWIGHFYPEKLPANAMLRYYGERFSTVEINNTFYRMPA